VKLIAITVARKPLSEGSVAKNVLKHGSGGFNIDASRLFCGTDHMQSSVTPRKADLTGAVRSQAAAGMFAPGTVYEPTNHPGGRWPANLILQHKSGCRRVGTKTVKGGNDPRRKDGSKPGHNFHGFDSPTAHDRRPCSHFGEGGVETVDAWTCEPGCPVGDLDGQSGVLTSGKPSGVRHTGGSFLHGGGNEYALTGFGDTGGASRYFKQLGGTEDR
jgi:hypothetical protein